MVLTTDASSFAIGVVLSQRDAHGKEEILYCYSRCITEAEKNYSVTEKELLAVVKGIQNFRHYLLGTSFILNTDHKALEHLNTAKNDNSRLLRWAMVLQECDFVSKYIKGDLNSADCSSRQILRINLKKNHKSIELNEKKKQNILREYHILSGHGSLANMYFLLKEKYQWKNIYKDKNNYIDRCKTCSKQGNPIINTCNKIITTTYTNEM